MNSHKIRFSNVISSVNFENGALVIKQFRLFAFILMFLFLATIVYFGFIHKSEMPLIVQIGIGFSSFFLIWGLWDVATSKVYFSYIPDIDFLQIMAKKKKFKLNFQGQGKQFLTLKTKEGFSNDAGEKTYEVVLVFSNDQCEIPLSLSGGSSQEAATKILEEWRTKLSM